MPIINVCTCGDPERHDGACSTSGVPFTLQQMPEWMEALRIVLTGFEDFGFYVNRNTSGSGWNVTEETTGCAIIWDRPDKEEAVNAAQSILELKGRESLEYGINEALQIMGIDHEGG